MQNTVKKLARVPAETLEQRASDSEHEGHRAPASATTVLRFVRILAPGGTHERSEPISGRFPVHLFTRI